MYSFLITVLLSFTVLVSAFLVFRYTGVPVYRLEAINVQRFIQLVLAGEATASDWDLFTEIPIRQDAALDKIRFECAMLASEVLERNGKLVLTEPARQLLASLLDQVNLQIEASK